MSFADNLQYLRKKNKITQEELADELGVSRQSVSKWETGEAYPETEKLILLSDKFGVTLDELIRGEPESADEEPVQEDNAPAREDKENEEEDDDEPEEEGQKEIGDDGEKGRRELIGRKLSAAIMLACVITYVCLGVALNLWHPAWLIFLGGVFACVWVGCFTEYAPGKSVKERIGGAVCGSAMIGSVIIYLSIGFTLCLWHPTWVVFIAAVGISGVVGALTQKKK